jgi:hypothetical protein
MFRDSYEKLIKAAVKKALKEGRAMDLGDDEYSIGLLAPGYLYEERIAEIGKYKLPEFKKEDEDNPYTNPECEGDLILGYTVDDNVEMSEDRVEMINDDRTKGLLRNCGLGIKKVTDSLEGSKTESEKKARKKYIKMLERQRDYLSGGKKSLKKRDEGYTPTKGFLSILDSNLLLNAVPVYSKRLIDEKGLNVNFESSVYNAVVESLVIQVEPKDFEYHLERRTSAYVGGNYFTTYHAPSKQEKNITKKIERNYNFAVLMASNIGALVDDQDSMKELYSNLEESKKIILPPDHLNPFVMLNFRIIGFADSGYGTDFHNKLGKKNEYLDRRIGLDGEQRSEGFCLVAMSEYDARILYFLDFKVTEDIISLEEVEAYINNKGKGSIQYLSTAAFVYPKTVFTPSEGERTHHVGFRRMLMKTSDMRDSLMLQSEILDKRDFLKSALPDRYVYSAHPEILASKRGIAALNIPHNPFRPTDVEHYTSSPVRLLVDKEIDNSILSAVSLSTKKPCEYGQIFNRGYLSQKHLILNLTESSEMSSLYEYADIMNDGEKIIVNDFTEESFRLDQPLYAPVNDEEAYKNFKLTFARILALRDSGRLPDYRLPECEDEFILDCAKVHLENNVAASNEDVLSEVKSLSSKYSPHPDDEGIEEDYTRLPDPIDIFDGKEDLSPHHVWDIHSGLVPLSDEDPNRKPHFYDAGNSEEEEELVTKAS